MCVAALQRCGKPRRVLSRVLGCRSMWTLPSMPRPTPAHPPSHTIPCLSAVIDGKRQSTYTDCGERWGGGGGGGGKGGEISACEAHIAP